MQNNNTTWVLVSCEAEAKIYRLTRFPKLEEFAFLEHPESRLHDRDLITSKPGRTFQKDGTRRSAYESKNDPKDLEIESFARHIADYLAEARRSGEFSRLYILASPYFLGKLRHHLDPQTQSVVVAEIAKDMVKHRKEEIEEQLSEL